MSETSAYTKIFQRLVSLITHPEKEWLSIYDEKSTRNDILTNFSLPLIGFMAIATFVSQIIYTQKFIWELALKQSAIVFMIHLGALFATWYILKLINKKKDSSQDDNQLFALIAYTAGNLYVLEIITILIPELFFFRILTIYIGYIAWKGLQTAQTDKHNQPLYTLLITLMLIVIPIIISKLAFSMIRFQ